MDFRQLRYFVGVVEAGSFTRAAASMHIAQSALSLHVRQLEDRFGTQLLIRDRTGLSLTAAGKKLLQHARPILQQVRSVEEELLNQVKSPSGEVTVGIPCAPARVIASELLSLARERLPRVTVKITEAMGRTIEDSMKDGLFNLAILYKESEGNNHDRPLAHEELFLVAPPNQSPFENVISLSSLHAYPLALPSRIDNIRQCLSDAARNHSSTLDVRFEVDSLSTIINMVTDGKAYSILTPSTIHRETLLSQLKTVRIVDPGISMPLTLAINPRDRRSIEVEAVRALIQEIVTKLVCPRKFARNTMREDALGTDLALALAVPFELSRERLSLQRAGR
ncbi:transcriptional regulator [Mesorhizobium sp. SARCC-RB16n]|uniref:LysR family transcriptional regulator n=1 Tax=Mesorhizobium sp. SARCC-RB16n TaxID=2116687 RepID=UPI00122EF251|nr:LysR substrate-binding domain-containing protein [Mesorhizobium sp. SARCC-RB16n]KAA3447259.1 transcriptional regulator [Mesorhizobium sp. SARCC-RB16n]